MYRFDLCLFKILCNHGDASGECIYILHICNFTGVFCSLVMSWSACPKGRGMTGAHFHQLEESILWPLICELHISLICFTSQLHALLLAFLPHSPDTRWYKSCHSFTVYLLTESYWNDSICTWSNIFLLPSCLYMCLYVCLQEDKVSHLREFVAYLTQRCHSEVTGSKVLWYDSVTRSGELKWQDQLNEENK